jgi:PAS domain S-box-containing protein
MQLRIIHILTTEKYHSVMYKNRAKTGSNSGTAASRLKKTSPNSSLKASRGKSLKAANNNIRIQPSPDIFDNKLFFDIAGVMLLILDTRGNAADINKRGLKILKCRPGEVIGKNWFDTFLSETEGREFKKKFKLIMKGKKSSDYAVNKVILKNGEERSIYWHNTVLKDKAGKIKGMFCSGEDFTDFKKIQAELNSRTESLTYLYELAHAISNKNVIPELFRITGALLINHPRIVNLYIYIYEEKSSSFLLQNKFEKEKAEKIPLPVYGPGNKELKEILKSKLYSGRIKLRKKKNSKFINRVFLPMSIAQSKLGMLILDSDILDDNLIDFYKHISVEIARGIRKRKIEESERLSEEKFSGIFHTSADPILISGFDDGSIIEVNESFIEFTGYSKKELTGKKLSEFNSLALFEKYPDFPDNLIRGKKISGFETELINKRGIKKNVLISTSLITLDSKEVLITIIKDITYLKESRNEVLKTKQMLEKIAYTSPAFISIYDVKNDIIIFSNKSILESLGYSAESVKKIRATEADNRMVFYHPGDKEVLDEFNSKAPYIKDGDILTAEYRIRDSNNNFKWFHHAAAAFQRDEKGNLTHTVDIFENIDERKKSEEEILKRSRQLELLNEAGRILSSTLDLYTLYDRMYEILSKIVDCTELILTSYDDKTEYITYDYLRSEATKGRIDVSKIPPIPLAPPGYGIISNVIRSGKSVILNDYRKDFSKVKTKYVVSDKGNLTGGEESTQMPRSALVVPLKLENRIFAVVQIFSTKLNAYTEEQMMFVESLMHQVALANNNALLYQQAQQELQDRKIAEENFRESEYRLRLFAESVPDVLYRYNYPEKIYDYLSPVIEKMMGYPLDKYFEQEGNIIDTLYHPDDKERIKKEISDYKKKGYQEHPLVIEARVKRNDGKYIWIRDSIKYEWENKKMNAALGVMSDITEKKELEENRKIRDELIINHQAALLKLSMFHNSDLPSSLHKITEITAEALKLDNSGIWLFDDKQEQLVCYDIYEVSQNRHSEGRVIKVDETKSYYNLLLKDETVNIIKSDETKISKDLCHSGNSSFIISKIRLHGKTEGILCLEISPDKNSWRPEHYEFALSASGFVTLALETNERRIAEMQIKNSLKDKELLLREIHHRVKNNLQVISSLLYLKSRRTKDKQVTEALLDSQHRVKSMVLIHEKLYSSQDLSTINYGEYIKALTGTLFRSYQLDSRLIELQLEVSDIRLNTDTAMHCGLIINELVSNSIKHAFPNGKTGYIKVKFFCGNDKKYNLIVSDNGIGLQPDFNFAESDSLGLQLVKTLVEQLDGTLEANFDNGSCFKIQFFINK